MPAALVSTTAMSSAQCATEQPDEVVHWGVPLPMTGIAVAAISDRRSPLSPIAAASASRNVRDAHDLDVVDVLGVARPTPAVPLRHDRPRESKAARLAQPALEAVDRTQLAGQADLAAQARCPWPSGLSRSADASATVSGRSIAGSSTDRPPTTLA